MGKHSMLDGSSDLVHKSKDELDQLTFLYALSLDDGYELNYRDDDGDRYSVVIDKVDGGNPGFFGKLFGR